MVKDARVTKNTRHSYATRSNLIKKVKTPGGRLSVKIIKKKSSGVKCGEPGCDTLLPGIKKMSTTAFRTSKKRERKATTPKPKKEKAAASLPTSMSVAVGQVCPLCGKGTIIRGKTAYGCSEWKNGCSFRHPLD